MRHLGVGGDFLVDTAVVRTAGIQSGGELGRRRVGRHTNRDSAGNA